MSATKKEAAIKVLIGKRVLITSWSLGDWGGATINAIELGEQFQKFGAVVDFFSYDLNGPVVDYIRHKLKSKVLTDSIDALAESESLMNNSIINIDDYDYIWVGANMLPISIIKQINTAKKLPKFIFIHMSALTGFPLDAPLTPSFERKIASKILSISDDTTSNTISRIMGKNTKVDYCRNPASEEFGTITKELGKLKNVAVISSSQPSREILDIKDSLESAGINIEYVGKYANNERRVDADLYQQFDLIVGIGKNVQYSLVSGVPVYIYGRFGGSGYLNSTNFDKNRANNFSGRGFKKKTSGQISREIIEWYEDAVKFHQSNRTKWMEEYSVDQLVKKIITDIEKDNAKKVKFSAEYINWMVSEQILLMQSMQRYAGLIEDKRLITNLQTRIECLEVDLQNQYNLGIKASLRRHLGSYKRFIKRRISNKKKCVLKPLKNKNFTMITNNCLAGRIYHDLGLEFRTPIINLWIDHSDFLLFVENMHEFIQNGILTQNKNSDKKYPVGFLVSKVVGKIEINFMHYDSFMKAKGDWERRKKRINWDDVRVVFDWNRDTPIEKSFVKRFSQLPYKHKTILCGEYGKYLTKLERLYSSDNFRPGKWIEVDPATGKPYYWQFDFVRFINRDYKPNTKIIAMTPYRFDEDYLVDWKKSLSGLADDFITTYDKTGELMRNEGKFREEMIREAENKGAGWVIVLDGDERFEKNATKKLKKLVKKYADQKVIFKFNYKELYKPNAYRIDGVWGEKVRFLMFPLYSDNEYTTRKLHAPKEPLNKDFRKIDTDINIYHLKHINPALRKHRVDLYNKLDKDHEWQEFGYDYLNDEKDMKLEKIPKGREYFPEYREYELDKKMFDLRNY
ncbi:hypothetical protein FACS189431_2590 [Alphaproteobacteria bacterium]|nr:hypothetical protein FACS189431_2590 [Alphaproteobacteria bacterium]